MTDQEIDAVLAKAIAAGTAAAREALRVFAATAEYRGSVVYEDALGEAKKEIVRLKRVIADAYWEVTDPNGNPERILAAEIEF